MEKDIIALSVPKNGGEGELLAKPEVAAAFEAANLAHMTDTGKPILVNSAGRSYEEQAKLYSELAGKQAVAKPGTSNHESYKALDIQNWESARPYLEAVGFKWANHKNDPFHFDFQGNKTSSNMQQGSYPGIPYQQPSPAHLGTYNGVNYDQILQQGAPIDQAPMQMVNYILQGKNLQHPNFSGGPSPAEIAQRQLIQGKINGGPHAPIQAPQQTNFFGDFTNSALNQGSFNALNLPHGNGVGAGLGTAAGGVLNGLTGLGLVAATPIAPELTIPLGFGLAGALGSGSQEARTQLNQYGRITDPMAIAGQGAVGGAMGLIPGSQAEGLLARTLSNAGRFGLAGGAGDFASQAIRNKGDLSKTDSKEILQGALEGGGLGALLSFLHKSPTRAKDEIPPPIMKLLTGGKDPLLLTGGKDLPIQPSGKEIPMIEGKQVLALPGEVQKTSEGSQYFAVDSQGNALPESTHGTFKIQPDQGPTKRLAGDAGVLQEGMGRTEHPAPPEIPASQQTIDLAPNKETGVYEQSFERPTTARRYAQSLMVDKGLAPEDIVIRSDASGKSTVKVEQKTYEPEIQAKLDQAKQNYQEEMASHNRRRPYLGEEQFGKSSKAAGMKYAAERRQIIQGDSVQPVENGLTGKELEKVVKYRTGNYAGKEVVADGQAGKVTTSAFGKIKVAFPDGTVKSFSPDKLEPINAQDRFLEQKQPLTDTELQRLNANQTADKVTPANDKFTDKPSDSPLPSGVKDFSENGDGLTPDLSQRGVNSAGRGFKLLGPHDEVMSTNPGALEAHPPEVLQPIADAIKANQVMNPETGQVLSYKYKGDRTSKVVDANMTPLGFSEGPQGLAVHGINENGHFVNHYIDAHETAGKGMQSVPSINQKLTARFEGSATNQGRQAKLSPDALAQGRKAVKELKELAPNDKGVQRLHKVLNSDKTTVEKYRSALQEIERMKANGKLNEHVNAAKEELGLKPGENPCGSK